jgi:NodT family efflux transporter outer membrane factor (OMF) lipoprotein
MKAFRRAYLIALAIITTTVPTACKKPPDFIPPAAPTTSDYLPEPLPPTTHSAATTGGQAQRFIRDMDIPARWWELFASTQLDTLVERALAANPTVDAAKAALRIAHENALAQRAAFFPTLQANITPTWQKNSAALSPTLSSNAPTFALYTTQVSVAYTPDVFGGNRRQEESLKAQEETQRFELEATSLTLISNVVAAAVQEASLREQIAATKHIIDAETTLLELLRRQQILGQSAKSDVVVQETALAQAQTTLPPLEKALGQTRDALSALAGRFPDEKLPETFELSRLELPRDVPISLPSRLVKQRPDVRAAEEQLHVATANVGVSIADMLPQFTLSGNVGTATTDITQAFAVANSFWTLGGNITQTLFDAGALRHKKRAEVAAVDQAAAQYRLTVLTAFQNVADTLRALQSDADTLRAAVVAQHAAAKSLTYAQTQLRLGGGSMLGVLNAEQSFQQTEIVLIQAKAARFADTAALFQALGGGWWNRTRE